jgi:uncharacterized spore protein YtfJ
MGGGNPNFFLGGGVKINVIAFLMHNFQKNKMLSINSIHQTRAISRLIKPNNVVVKKKRKKKVHCWGKGLRVCFEH